MTPFFTGMVIVAFVVVIAAALDLFSGGKGLAALDRILNRKIDTDTAIVKGLSAIRSGVEREVINVDKALTTLALKRIVAVLMLAAVAFLAYTIFFRHPA